MTLKAALYLRLSVSRDESTSIERQERDLRDLADREGWEVSEVLIDDGFSGGSRRAKADRALDMLRASDIDVIAVWKFDRWSRQGVRAVADLVDVIDARAAARKPALFVALADGIRSDQASWRMHVSLIAEVGRLERENTAARVASARALQRRARKHSGVVPFGYRTVPHPSGQGRALELDPVDAATVRRARDLVLGGMSAYAVARILNEEGRKPRSATAWASGSVADLLRRDSLLGYMTHRRPGDSSRTRRPLLGGDGLPEQVWPPIITRDEAVQLRTLLSARSHVGNVMRSGAPRPKASRLLSGMIACSTCGSALRVNYTDKLKDGTRRARYVCSAPAGSCAAKVSIHATYAEDFVVGQFLAVAGRLAVVEMRETASAHDELAEVERAIRETTSEMADPAADLDELVQRLTQLRATRERLEVAPETPQVEAVETGETFAEAWETRDLLGRRYLLSSVLRGPILVHPAPRGARKITPERVAATWAWTEPDVDAELADAARAD
ncbi:recombinase family protein [Arthrobacter pityocampae]|uniref:recombinase family protein n=1 Tax=Arthrobacter pityocampae TaxID=547334 RepID=UPI00142D2ABF|nr:recombinase family protein [Arthrobacter pityocampae]